MLSVEGQTATYVCRRYAWWHTCITQEFSFIEWLCIPTQVFNIGISGGLIVIWYLLGNLCVWLTGVITCNFLIIDSLRHISWMGWNHCVCMLHLLESSPHLSVIPLDHSSPRVPSPEHQTLLPITIIVGLRRLWCDCAIVTQSYIRAGIRGVGSP